MEQLPSQTSSKEDQTEGQVTEICKDNFNTTDQSASQLSAKTEQNDDTNHKENIKVTDRPLKPSTAKDIEKGPTAFLRNNSKGNSKVIPKLACVKFNKPQTKVVPQKKLTFTNSKFSSLPTPSKNKPPAGATAKTANPTGKSEIPGTATTTTTSPVKSKIPGVNKRVSNISLPSKIKNNQPQQQSQPQAQSQQLRSSSKLSLNKTESTRTGTNRKIIPTFSKSSFVTTASNLSGAKGEIKSQSARCSGSIVPGANKRSVSNISSRPQTNLRKMISTAGDNNIIESWEKKLENEQTEFLHNIENVKSVSPEKLKCDYKFITMVRNEECKLMIKDDELRELSQKLPLNSVGDFKEKIRKYIEDWFATFMDNIKDSNESATINVESIQDKWEKLQILKSNGILSYIDELCSSYEDTTDSQIVKMQNALQESGKTLKKSEKELKDLIKQHEEDIIKLEKDLKDKADTSISQKNAKIQELNKRIKFLEKQNETFKNALQVTEQENQTEIADLRKKFESSKDSIASLNKKLHTMEQQLSSEKKNLKAKNENIEKLENDLLEMENLKNSLAEMTTHMEKLKAEPQAANDCPEHLRQIADLQSVINLLENDKINKKQKIDKLEAESTAIIEVRHKLKEAENHIRDLETKLEMKGKLPETIHDCAENLQMELSKVRQSDEEKRREIENLKVVLSKYQFNMCQLEQHSQRDQQLLQVRSELINSLQTNEKSQRSQMEELLTQVGEKNTIISELQSELQTKSEEFKNLFSTFSAKQMELSNQEHIIKLLEESNERSQMLRVKQEEKIGRMEEELTHLKQTIKIYEQHFQTAFLVPY